MLYPCSHLYSTKFSSGGGGQVPRKLSHSLNSSVHKPSLVQTMGTCKAEGEQPVLLPAVAGFTLPGHCPALGGAKCKDPTPASEVQREVLQGSWVAAIWSSLCVLCITGQKRNCFPGAAGSHQRESTVLLLTRPFQQVGCETWEEGPGRQQSPSPGKPLG